MKAKREDGAAHLHIWLLKENKNNGVEEYNV